MGRTSDAVEAYENAARRFELRGEPDERAKAIYGEARMLSDAHRCKEAWRKFQQYAVIMQHVSPDDAKMARTYANDCHGEPADREPSPPAPLP